MEETLVERLLDEGVHPLELGFRIVSREEVVERIREAQDD